jgi:hypothetical protein
MLANVCVSHYCIGRFRTNRIQKTMQHLLEFSINCCGTIYYYETPTLPPYTYHYYQVVTQRPPALSYSLSRERNPCTPYERYLYCLHYPITEYGPSKFFVHSSSTRIVVVVVSSSPSSSLSLQQQLLLLAKLSKDDDDLSSLASGIPSLLVLLLLLFSSSDDCSSLRLSLSMVFLSLQQ